MSEYKAFCPHCDKEIRAVGGTLHGSISYGFEKYEYLVFNETGEVIDEGVSEKLFLPDDQRDWDNAHWDQLEPRSDLYRCVRCKRWTSADELILKEVDEEYNVIDSSDADDVNEALKPKNDVGHEGNGILAAPDDVEEGDYVIVGALPGSYEGAVLNMDDDDAFVVAFEQGDYPTGEWDDYDGLWAGRDTVWRVCGCSKCREQRAAQKAQV